MFDAGLELQEVTQAVQQLAVACAPGLNFTNTSGDF